MPWLLLRATADAVLELPFAVAAPNPLPEAVTAFTLVTNRN
jgi:hypothetical protein